MGPFNLYLLQFHDDLISLKHLCRPSPIAYGLTASCSHCLMSLSSQQITKVLELTVVFFSFVCTTSPRTGLASDCMKLIILPFMYVLWQKSRTQCNSSLNNAPNDQFRALFARSLWMSPENCILQKFLKVTLILQV